VIRWHNHHVEQVEVDLLLQALKDRYGYDFTGYAHASLKRRLMELKKYFDITHLSELIPMLLYDERMARTIVGNISVPVSDFFRDPPVWRFMREEILPRLDSFPQINIWQAGCGRGQETYTLLILLAECGLLKKTRLVATDINDAALDEARQARWPGRDFDQWQAAYRATGGKADLTDYFRRDGDSMCFANDELRQAVEFNRHNLVADDVFMEAQLVICRNVLIYFGSELQDKVLQLFARALQRGGYLLLGRAESLPESAPNSSTISESFQRIDDANNVFRRIQGGAHV
jgi:chemotaxis protein methyltransferase CheR